MDPHTVFSKLQKLLPLLIYLSLRWKVLLESWRTVLVSSLADSLNLSASLETLRMSTKWYAGGSGYPSVEEPSCEGECQATLYSYKYDSFSQLHDIFCL